MLAKSWKKILLAVCIVACIFNLMLKLVNRHSLKENLESANDGVTVFDIFKKDDIELDESYTTINKSNADDETSIENSDKIEYDENYLEDVANDEFVE